VPQEWYHKEQFVEDFKRFVIRAGLVKVFQLEVDRALVVLPDFKSGVAG
jgi:hypothetical protein